jgi:hypothetical protein
MNQVLPWGSDRQYDMVNLMRSTNRVHLECEDSL